MLPAMEGHLVQGGWVLERLGEATRDSELD